jgi:hypothetical protein
MMARMTRRILVLAAALAMTGLGSSGTLRAETTLKWAHVYEISEPYHT